MILSPRRTRSQTIAAASCPIVSPQEDEPNAIATLPVKLTASITGLERTAFKLLQQKQTWLSRNTIEIPRHFDKNRGALDATLVFAQEEAGTAVCISPNGLVLTCSHCVAENEEELDNSRLRWLVFRSGKAVAAKCVAWDPVRDLALLQVIEAQNSVSEHGDAAGGASPNPRTFPHVNIANTPPSLKSRLVCIGHPGSDDLEAAQPGIKTDYDVLHLSTGVFRGYADGQDLQDNSEIGALKHDCWTYWGHSGAPLLTWKTGELIGLHSSWDEETGMRRGIPLEAIKEFLTVNRRSGSTLGPCVCIE